VSGVKNVLVIDQNAIARMILEEELKSVGCKVSFSDSATQGLELASRLNPDFITVDLAFKDMGGIELIKRLKDSKKAQSAPFLVVTGIEDPIQKQLCVQAGAVNVVHKPFSHGTVGALVKNYLDSSPKVTGRTILVVEDSGTIRAITRHLLERQGHSTIEAVDGLKGWKILNDNHTKIDMVVTDINMPNMDGRELVEKIRSDHRFQFIPIIVSTTIAEKENVQLMLNLGADDYIVKPFSTQEFIARIHSHLRVKSLYEELHEANTRLSKFNETLENRVNERTFELKQANLDAIFSLATAAEAKDYDTGFHVHRIQRFSETLAIKLGFPKDEAAEIGYSSIMHDVGKISIPDQILKKPGKLTKEEFETIKTHTVYGEKILSDKPFFRLAKIIARHHHEKWDGSGYPDGLAKEEIPLVARLVAVADVFDALIHARPYKEAWPIETAMEEIIKTSGSHFDSTIVKAWQELYENGAINYILKEWE